MAIHSSPILRGVATLIRTIEFLGMISILAVMSTYLARLSTRHDAIPQKYKAVEGISGAGVLYTAFAVLLTCFLGGKKFFAFLAVVFDALFVVAMVASAVLTRQAGTSKCYFNGDSAHTNGSRIIILSAKKQRTDCHLVKAAFAVSVILAFLFVISAAMQLSVQQAHTRSHETHHTNPRGGRFSFGRKRKVVNTYDAEMATRA